MKFIVAPAFMVALIAGVAALPAGALAQKLGTYSGSSADGQSINFVVSTDPNTGAKQITSFGLGIAATCKPGGSTYNTGWGLGGDGQDIVGNKHTFNYAFGYLDLITTMVFKGDAVSGTVVSYTPTFFPYTGSTPKKSVLCTSAKQTYSATLTSPSDLPAAKQPGAVLYSAPMAKPLP